MAGRDFNKEAAAWDTPPRIKLSNDIAAAIMRQIPLEPDMDILDFGCGTGLLSLALQSKVGSVTGVDTSQGMLDMFNAKITGKKIPGARTVLLDPDKGLKPDKSYHLIVSAMTMHHIRDIEPLMAAFHNALLPEGYLALADLDEEGGAFHNDPEGVFHNGFQRDALEKILHAAGFKGIRCEQAAEISKPSLDGSVRKFSVFLMTGRRIK
jgi:predicted TPR repeat methyltransferase